MQQHTEALAAVDASHAKERYPHEPECPGCRVLRLCNVCGGSSRLCPNGRCLACHGAVCTPGGDQLGDIGHGYGSSAAAELQARRRECGGKFPAELFVPDENVARGIGRELIALHQFFTCEKRDQGWMFLIETESSER